MIDYIMIYLAINCFLFYYAHDSIQEIKKDMGLPPTVWPQFLIILIFGIPIYIIAAIKN